MSLGRTLITSRLEVRPPRELDRGRFVELFCNDDFMIFSGQALTEEAAHGRFDHMLAMCEVVPFAKQPIVERASGLVVGYTGVDYFTFEGGEPLEWGYRLVPESRGFGYVHRGKPSVTCPRSRDVFGRTACDNRPRQPCLPERLPEAWFRLPEAGACGWGRCKPLHPGHRRHRAVSDGVSGFR